MSDYREHKKNYKNKKKSTRSIKINHEIKEKCRFLRRSRPLYDSFDENESDKEEKNEGSCILPSNYFIYFLDSFLFLSTIYSLFYIPLTMARSDYFCGQENIINIILLYFVDLLYILDFSLSFFRAYYNFQLKLIKNNSRIFFHYLKTDAFFDFLEAIPIYTYNKYLCSKSKEVNYCFRYNMPNSLIFLKIITNLKILKAFKVRNKKKNITFNYLFSENYFIEQLIDNLIDFSFCFLAFHFFVCLNIFLSKQTYPNWLISNNFQDQSLTHNYIASSYSLIETLTTVGYGDLVCQCNIERIFQIFFLGVGVIAYSYLISSFGNLFKNESQSSINYSNNMKILEEIRVDYPKMPYKLYNKIYNYIESRNMAEKKSDTNILTNSLPFNLKNALLLIMYEADIKNFKFFKNCQNSNFIIQVLSNFVPSTSKKHEFLIYEGEMIEDLIIIKDGRLSLEAAIDMEDPESSIRKYFNVNFQGITTEKEIKKLNELQKVSTCHLFQTKKTKNIDNAKLYLNNEVKKKARDLFNEACDDLSILDKTKYENNKSNEELFDYKTNEHLKHEPIKNEKGNYKYIKILDIRKNENFGGLYMFMRRPSPLSLKVRSKFAELYLLPKKEVFNIAKNYHNIWNKIHKKDFHNMLSIKHQTFNILNKYIEISGIGKISSNDVSRFVYPWEDLETKNKRFNDKFIKEKKNINDNIDGNKSYDKLNFSQTSNNLCPRKFGSVDDYSPINKNNNIYLNGNLFSDHSLDKVTSPKYKEQKEIPKETDFSQLLKLISNEKQKKNFNNNNLNNNNNSNNININNDNNCNIGEESSHILASNLMNDKRKTKGSYEEGNTIILHKNSENLLQTLNNIFNEKKVEEIKDEMKKARKKENRKKIFAFGKKTAELFRNENYSIFLVGKTTNECIEIKNKNNLDLSNASLLKYNVIDDELNEYISLCQDNNFLDKIPEISSSEEYSSNKFFKKDLSQEAVISFSLNSIYQNINIHTKMKYSKNKDFQQKTLIYLTKLIEGKITSSSIDSNISKSNSIILSFSDNDKKSKKSSIISSHLHKEFNSSLNNSILNSNKSANLLYENNILKSENSKKKIKNKKNNNKIKLYNSQVPRNIKIELSDKKDEFNSLSKKHIKYDSKNIKEKLSDFKDVAKLTFKAESNNNEKSRRNEFNSIINLNENKNSKIISSEKTNNLNINKNSNFLDLFPDKIINNVKTDKNSTNERININKRMNEGSERKSHSKRTSKVKLTKISVKKKKMTFGSNITKKKKKKHQPNKFKSEQKLIKIETKKEGGIRNSVEYFAKEEKEDCLII